MKKLKAFLRRKDIEISIKRYGIDALGAMAQGLFCSLLIGTIINTLGTQFHISFLTTAVATVNDTQYTVGSLASAMSGPAMAVAIGYALHCPPLVLFSLITVGFASNALGGAGGPLAVLFVAIFASEIGKAVSKETKIDILVTPLVTIGVGIALSAWWAPALGSAAMKESTHLDRTDPYFCHHRTSCNLSVQTSDERYSGFFRYGYLRFCRTDWCLHRMDE